VCVFYQHLSTLPDIDYKEKLALEKHRQRIERELRMLDDDEQETSTRENIRIEKKMQMVSAHV